MVKNISSQLQFLLHAILVVFLLPVMASSANTASGRATELQVLLTQANNLNTITVCTRCRQEHNK